ncbi:MAG: MFS transporter, partial [Halobacteriaceae archaeon]
MFGIGTGLFGTARGIALSEFFPKEAGIAFGITLAGGSLGSALLSFGGGIGAQYLGWRVTLGILFPVFLGLLFLTWWILPSLEQTSIEETDFSINDLITGIHTAIQNNEI